jgi:hypothetical protein
MGQKAKYSLGGDVFRFTLNSGHAVARHDRFVPTSDLCMQQRQFRALAAGEIKEARTRPHSLGKSSTITTRVMLSAAFFADI